MSSTGSDWTVVGEGVRRRIIQDGDKLMMVQVEFESGAVTAEHVHPHEQVTYVVSGRMRFTLEGKDIEVGAGQSIFLASNVPHGAKAMEPSLLLDVFSPPREDFRAR